jgi:hypothetical protein
MWDTVRERINVTEGVIEVSSIYARELSSARFDTFCPLFVPPALSIVSSFKIIFRSFILN